MPGGTRLSLKRSFGNPFDIDEAFTRALINEHTSGITGIHLKSLPAPGRLETWMSWGLARLGTAMECRERSVESFESGVLYAPVERSFNVREVLAYCRKRPALLSERDRLLVAFPGRGPLLEGGVVEQTLLGKHIIQPDVACPAQVGTCAICTNQPRMLCYRGIVWRALAVVIVSLPPMIISDTVDWKAHSRSCHSLQIHD